MDRKQMSDRSIHALEKWRRSEPEQQWRIIVMKMVMSIFIVIEVIITAVAIRIIIMIR